MTQSPSNKAVLAGILSFTCWGFFPIYWKFLNRIPPTQILAQRMVWSCLFYMGVYVFISWRTQPWAGLMRTPIKVWLSSLLASLVLALNWGIYIYAVNSGQIIQGSLAYFINPLLNVAVGVLFFQEKLPKPVRLAMLFAAAGVLLQVAFAKSFPIIALSLAVTFCFYGLLKKKLEVPANLSSAMEGLCGLIPAIGLWMLYPQNIEPTAVEWSLLVFSGVVTGLPLLLFSIAAQKLPMSALGMMQFIAPSLQFLVGVGLYGERLDTVGFVSFGLVWVGIALYLRYLSRSRRAAAKALTEAGTI